MDRPKVFVVGHNKTGTTSVAVLLRRMGYQLGDQARAEALVPDWIDRRFDRIVSYCRTAEAFQDAPFSYWDTYRALDEAYPDARFVLTVRDSREWFRSSLRWGQRLTGVTGRRPTFNEAGSVAYRTPHWFLHSHLTLYDVPPSALWDRERYVAAYERHNRQVQEHFASRPEKLLVLDVKEDDAVARLGSFLDVDAGRHYMPHRNRTA